jgi:hypothetical protein
MTSVADGLCFQVETESSKEVTLLVFKPFDDESPRVYVFEERDEAQTGVHTRERNLYFGSYAADVLNTLFFSRRELQRQSSARDDGGCSRLVVIVAGWLCSLFLVMVCGRVLWSWFVGMVCGHGVWSWCVC